MAVQSGTQSRSSTETYWDVWRHITWRHNITHYETSCDALWHMLMIRHIMMRQDTWWCTEMYNNQWKCMRAHQTTSRHVKTRIKLLKCPKPCLAKWQQNSEKTERLKTYWHAIDQIEQHEDISAHHTNQAPNETSKAKLKNMEAPEACVHQNSTTWT